MAKLDVYFTLKFDEQYKQFGLSCNCKKKGLFTCKVADNNNMRPKLVM